MITRKKTGRRLLLEEYSLVKTKQQLNYLDKLKNMIPVTVTMKYGDGSIMLWRCFTGTGISALQTVDRHHNEGGISWKTEAIRHDWVFQQNSDPNHTSNWAYRWQVSLWPLQSSDQWPIEFVDCIEKLCLNNKTRKPDRVWTAVSREISKNSR